MTEVDLVATAFATGAAASGTVHDLYDDLRETVRRRLTGAEAGEILGDSGMDGRYTRGYGIRVLDAYETDPDVWRTRLLQVLTGTGAWTDEAVLAAARAVLRAERRPALLRDGGAAHNGSGS
ncbi:hypothetical protein [Streptomyces ipomoeae]|uniref:hypothetical protein n=1 Tax=Streptomyces ipomoeae TaxID=103232 RepID=UPI001146A93B|nr:hypothetical protein [Streptomyces ipomoeae]MDX2939087.1 hypothetical protein [Streptomyces ipomoeae]TQE20552.1 hypothetical protein SipoB123_28140 [Streptomyces ipomoeae]